MRVCIVTVAGYVHGIGGMQTHTSDLASGLVAAGHEVEVVTGRHPEGRKSEEHVGAVWHFVDAPTRYGRLPMRHAAWLSGSHEEFARLHETRPFDLVHSESTSALGLLRRRVHEALPLVAKFHGNWLGLAGAAFARAARSPRTFVPEAKHVVWIIGQHFLPPDNAYAFRACEAMVPSRQQLEETRRSHLLRRDRIHVVPNAVDTRLFLPRPRDEARNALGLGAAPLLVSVGRLNREKGMHHAIHALTSLGDVKLALVGAGEERPGLERLAHEIGVADRVLFAGKQPREAVAAYLAAADVFLFPTERAEAAPMVLPEAMACGIPVVASRIGGIPEVVGPDEATALLVPPGDVEALVGAVRRLLGDPDLAARLGKAARSRIEEEYTLERMVERTLHVYRIAGERLGRAL